MATAGKTSAAPGSAATAAKAIDDYLRAHWSGSPLAGKGSAFAATGGRYGVHPCLLAAIAGAETSFATDPGAGEDIRSRHNPFGLGPHLPYPTWEAAIEAAGRTIGNYLRDGLTTVDAIQMRWAPIGAANDPRNQNSEWRRNVKAFFKALGGDPAQTVAWKPGADTGGGAGAPGPGASQLVALAKRSMRAVYSYGGDDPAEGFDSSGFVYWLYGQFGVTTPRRTYEQYRFGTAVAKSALRAGDVVFFAAEPKTADHPAGPGHAGLYVGGGKFIEYVSGSAGRIIALGARSDYVGARRFWDWRSAQPPKHP